MKKLIAAAMLASCVAGSAFAQAREFDPTPHGFSFRLGAAWPQDGDLRGDRESWAALGVDYNIQTSILRTGDSFLSLDYINSDFGGGGDAIVPIMLGNRFYSGDMDMNNRSYFLFGLGAVVFQGDDNEVNFGGILGGGVNMGEHLFFEGRFNFSAKVEGVSTNAFGLYVGYRF